MLSLYGEDLSNKSAKQAKNIIKQLTLNDIWGNLFGITFSFDPSAGNNKLIEVKREDKFDNGWIQDFQLNLTKSYKDLSKIGPSYKAQTEINNERFYYIEREFLPGGKD